MLDRGCAPGKDIGVGIGRGACHESRMREEVRCAPQEFRWVALLFFCEIVDHLVEVGERLAQTCTFGGDITVVEGVEGKTEHTEEFKGRVGFHASALHRVLLQHPGPINCGAAKGIAPSHRERMPPRDGKAQMLAEWFSQHDLVRLVKAICEGIGAGRAFEGNCG